MKRETPAAAEFVALAQALDELVCVWISDGPLLWQNAAFERHMGPQPERPSLFHPDDRHVVDDASRLVECHGSRSDPFAARMLLPSGAPLAVSLTLSRIVWDGRDSLLVVARPLEANHRRAEAERWQAEKLESLRALAGGIAHDFGNIMTGVLANAAFAESWLAQAEDSPSGVLPSSLKEVLSEVRHAAERAGALHHLLLTYMGQTSGSFETLDLTAVIDTACRMSHGSSITVHRGDLRRPVFLRGDRQQLAQMIEHALANAIEAIGTEPGEIWIDLQPRSASTPAPAVDAWVPGSPPHRDCGYAYLTIRDSGPGLPAASLSRIFDPFFSTKGLHRGLGLATALGVLRSHGGFAGVSRGPGRGTTFTFCLPMLDSPPAPLERGMVLIVDDEPSIRRVAQRALERAGYVVQTAALAEDAWEAFGAAPDRYIAAVVDHRMPGMSGDALVRKIRGVRTDFPIVHTSASKEANEVPGSITIVLPKPFRPEQLIRAVQRLTVRDSLSSDPD